MASISTIQLNSGPNVQANLLVVSNILEQIAQTKSKMVVLPENFALMPEKDSEFLSHAEEDGNGVIQNFIAENAKKYNLWIVAGRITI